MSDKEERLISRDLPGLVSDMRGKSEEKMGFSCPYPCVTPTLNDVFVHISSSGYWLHALTRHGKIFKKNIAGGNWEEVELPELNNK